MKKEILFKVMPIFVLIWIAMTSSSWAGLVVTDDIRSWAKKVVSEEHALDAVSAPNTVAVLDFFNKTQWAALDPVQKGIALMLITDLSRVKGVQLVERARLTAICDELQLSKSSLVEEGTRSRLGKLLGAGHLIGGDILKGGMDEFQLNSILMEVKNEDVLGRASAQGKFLDGIFAMEKKILFDIVEELKIKLSSGEEEKLKRPLTNNLDALLNLFQALEFSDHGDYARASECLKKALEKDPNLTLAQEFLTEITELTGAEGYSEEFGPDEDSQPQTDTGEKDDPHDRDNVADADGDGFTIENGDCNDNDPSICPSCQEIPYDGIDQNCDDIDLTDLDGDGHDALQAGGDDCDDGDPAVNPGMTEVPFNNKDDDCDPSTPDGDYTGGDQPPVVDMASVDMARESYNNDSSLAGRVDIGYYTPGGLSVGSPEPDGDYPGIEQWPVTWGGAYKYGLQTVGKYFDQESETAIDTVMLLDSTHNLINQYPFLSYVVQVEEDRLNEKTIEMYQKADKYADLDLIKDQLQCDDILARDALLTQQADAQAGRVLRDHNGDWVRVQQYVLRPDTQTVQVLNVCLRGSGVNAGLSTMDFTTKFAQGYSLNYNLSALNWDSWLTTLSDGQDYKYIETHMFMYPELSSMSVEFKNPAGESLRESRTFAGKEGEGTWAMQRITTEELELVNSSGTSELYGRDHISGNDYPSGNFSTVGLEWGGFDYVMPTGSDSPHVITARFFSVDDYGQGEAESEGGIYDIWAAFKVGLDSRPEFVTNNRNLEIVLSNGPNSDFYSQDTDIVYIPMSRMVWREKENPIW